MNIPAARPSVAPAATTFAFPAGPDQQGDLLLHRPYFLVPLDESEAALASVRDRILAWMNDTYGEDGVTGVTDIYLISHGWHRVFFSALSAYDRLFSRFALLQARGRLASSTPTAPPADRRPLFLMLHWHSDPGQDGLSDPQGRRHRNSFLAGVEQLFARPTDNGKDNANNGENFTNTFEGIFQFLTQMSVPDGPTHRLAAMGRGLQAQTLASALDTFSLLDAPNAPADVKVTAVWRCYFESMAQRPLANQGAKPAPFESFWAFTSNLCKFLFATLGPLIVTFLVYPNLWFHTIPHWLETQRNDPHSWVYWLCNTPPVQWFVHLPLWQCVQAAPLWFRLAVGLLAALATLLACTLWSTLVTQGKRSRGIPVVAVAAWAPLQVFVIVPLLLFLLLMAIVDALLAGFFNLLGMDAPFGLYNERAGSGRRDNPELQLPPVTPVTPTLQTMQTARTARTARTSPRARWTMYLSPRLAFAGLARFPTYLLRRAVARDTPLPGFIQNIDDQFAFWEMQVHGVQSGGVAAAFLSDVLAHVAQAQPNAPSSAESPTSELVADLATFPRIHFVGHSFGGLVVANAVRHLALTPQYRKVVPCVHSICLLQAAMASTWFEREESLRTYLTGTLACIFSGYDTANGFYYLVANASRLAAGFVGLTKLGGTGRAMTGAAIPVNLPPLDEPALFASVVDTPDLPALANLPPPSSTPASATPLLVNLDASRLIFDGPAAAGGGHDDIFKDDVIQLLWAATTT